MFRIITFLICFSVMSAQDFRQTVAVFDFEGNGISQLEATTLTNRFRTASGDAGAMRLIERGMMEEVLQEQGFQQTGCTSDECAVEVGQLLGVQNMIGGSIGKVGDTFTIDVRMVSVQTGESLVTKQTTYAGRVDGLIIEIEILAYEFFGVKVPEQLLEKRKIGIPITSSEIIKQKTKLGAILRSTIVPGLGQFYSGKNILGGSFFLSEIALLGLIYSSFNKYSSSTDQYNDLIPIYNSTRDPNMLFDLRNDINSNVNSIESSKNTIDQLSTIVIGIWALNIAHAFLLNPANDPIAKVSTPFEFAYDPISTSHQIRFSIELD